MLKRFFAAVLLTAALLVPAAADEPHYSIENVTGDLYLFRAGNTNSVFLVGKQGIILVDPISHDAATWLKGALDRRFNLPVTYVIYSHGHADHASGGEVFAGTAQFISHYLAARAIEALGIGPVPTIRFPHAYYLRQGEAAVELRYFGPSHTDHLITVVFPNERAVFIVDAAGVNRLPYRDLSEFVFPEAIAVLKKIEELDFDIFIPGHGAAGTKADLAAHRQYLDTLQREVFVSLQQGISIEDMRRFIRLDQYEDWANYEAWRELNVEGMARILLSRLAADAPLSPVEERAAVFPPSAEKMGISGWVALEFDVTEAGETANIRIVDSAASSQTRGITDFSRFLASFEKNALKAVAKMRFPEGFPRTAEQKVVPFYAPPRADYAENVGYYVSNELFFNFTPDLYRFLTPESQRSGRRE